MAAPQEASAAVQSRAKILEGVDFIETEEDAEAVESAVVKIQSTFRGKKIRSKLNQKQPEAEQQIKQADQVAKAEELSKKVATMEVNDKASEKQPIVGYNLPEDEAQRAATKIQAGFKGYKTRKELEGIISSGQPAGQEADQGAKG